MADIFTIFAMNENGIFTGADHVTSTLVDAMDPAFDFQDLFIYSHGWWTIADSAMDLYSRYVVEFNKNLATIYGTLNAPPKGSFGLGLHWPSTVSENMNNFLEQAAQSASYYQMGARAEQVGATGLYAALTLMLQKRCQSGKPPNKLSLLGHSFGCRVISSALQRMAIELTKSTADQEFKTFIQDLQMRVVLLEPAYKNTELDPGGNYDAIAEFFPKSKLLITTSQLDYALNHYFPIAEDLNNIVHWRKPNALALGGGIPPLEPLALEVREQQPNATAIATDGAGPTKTTWKAFGGPGPDVEPIRVDLGFMPKDINLLRDQRIAVADLTPIHTANLQKQGNADEPEWTWETQGGSHSDISCPAIHNLIAGFAFNN